MQILINSVLLFILFCSSIGVMLGKTLIIEVMYSAIFSMTLVLLYLVMSAPDVALTEAAVGAYITALLIFWSGILIRDNEHQSDIKKNLLIMGSVYAFGIILILYSSFFLPQYGALHISTGDTTHEYYLNESFSLFGFPNVVTAILAGFRGYDTLIETTVVFASAVSAFFLTTCNTSHKSTKENN